MIYLLIYFTLGFLMGEILVYSYRKDGHHITCGNYVAVVALGPIAYVMGIIVFIGMKLNVKRK